jgi:hypothetical protein
LALLWVASIPVLGDVGEEVVVAADAVDASGSVLNTSRQSPCSI